MKYDMIVDDAALAELCADLSGATRLGIDTEFMRERTYRPKLGLVQISDGERHALVDPLAVGNLEPLFGLLRDEKILKILHAPREDLEIFVDRSGSVCAPIFDTQIAAAFGGVGYSMSYQNLVRELLGEQVSKVQTRTDWLRRPLSQDQERYAILDVVHLHALHDRLLERLRERGRESWAEEEFRVLERIAVDEDPRQYYRRVKQSWRLTRRQLGVLRELCAWREEEAFERDVIRPNVVADDALVDLAKMQPKKRRELSSLKRLHPREISRSGDVLLEKIAEARALPDSELPEGIPAPISDPVVVARADFLSTAVRMRAIEMQISPEVLCRKRSLEELAKRYLAGEEDPFPAELRGWRREVLGDYLLDLLRGRIGFRINPDPAGAPLGMFKIDDD